MSAQPSRAFATPKEYLALEAVADLKSEYISGEISAMSGASRRHERISVNLIGILFVALQDKPCRTVGGNMRVRVRKTNYLYPDLTLVCGDELYDDSGDLDALLNPTVVFEILSHTMESRDRGIKWRLYQQVESVDQYVMIHQDTACVEVFTRQSATDWLVHTEVGLGGILSLRSPGVSIPLSVLYDGIEMVRTDDEA